MEQASLGIKIDVLKPETSVVVFISRRGWPSLMLMMASPISVLGRLVFIAYLAFLLRLTNLQIITDILIFVGTAREEFRFWVVVSIDVDIHSNFLQLFVVIIFIFFNVLLLFAS